MIFHHPELLFDLRPHTCEEGGQTACPGCLSAAFQIPPALNLPLRDLRQSPRTQLFEHAKGRRFFHGGECFLSTSSFAGETAS